MSDDTKVKLTYAINCPYIGDWGKSVYREALYAINEKDAEITDLTTKLAEADAVIRDAQKFIDGDESLQGLEMAIADYLTRPINK